MKPYSLIYWAQTDAAVGFKESENDSDLIWLPKSAIEVDGVSHESDFAELIRGEELDVYAPDWLAEDKDLL